MLTIHVWPKWLKEFLPTHSLYKSPKGDTSTGGIRRVPTSASARRRTCTVSSAVSTQSTASSSTSLQHANATPPTSGRHKGDCSNENVQTAAEAPRGHLQKIDSPDLQFTPTTTFRPIAGCMCLPEVRRDATPSLTPSPKHGQGGGFSCARKRFLSSKRTRCLKQDESAACASSK